MSNAVRVDSSGDVVMVVWVGLLHSAAVCLDSVVACGCGPLWPIVVDKK